MSKVAMSQSAGRATGFVLVLVVGMFGSPRVVRADDAPSSPPKSDSSPAADGLVIARMVPGEPLAADDAVSIAADGSTFVMFPAVMTVTNHAAVERVVTFVRVLNWLFLQAVDGAPIGATATVELSTRGYPPTSIPVRVQRRGMHTREPLIVLPKADMRRFQSEAAAKRQADEDAVRADERRKREAAVKNAERLAFVKGVHHSAYRYVRLDDQDCVGEQITICGELYTRTEKDGVFRVTIDNRTSHEIATETLHARVVDQVGGRDHAVFVSVTDTRERPVSAIAPGARVKLSVLVDEPDTLGKSVRFVLAGAVPVLPADRFFRVPSPTEWAENERRKERIEREAKRVSLHLVASYGAIWLDDGIDGTDTLKPASLKGLGLRFTKGVTPMWALEAEIGGATSGTADYGTVTVDGTEGELTRSAKLGRVSLGGVLRFGDKIVPHARLGVALQVVSQDASMVTTGGEMSGPESGIEVAGGVYGGAGVDFKLGSNLVAGVGLSYTAAQSDQRILDFWLNLAYRWDPPSG